MKPNFRILNRKVRPIHGLYVIYLTLAVLALSLKTMLN